MASRITELIVGSREPERLAAFWCEVLGYVVVGRADGDTVIGPPDGSQGLRLIFSRTDPTHPDLSPVDRDQDAELERLLALGAAPADVGQTGEEPWRVLTDPDGNLFCLLRNRVAD
ncbi:VOC family protein [Tenggerimyces flavus]|uniref:VOC family protein n=1 Tax=Tenggerimyces flavus TaxID=1708749 RepID=A0ABV7YLY7_9ACTN|nr:VOC family protein [Tenggerimyces flavus]MBM7787439.1 catechol 2,3-dioxygenase-like lactoylglutathione lyase family enzyme [Tenggerimyces flavus]